MKPRFKMGKVAPGIYKAIDSLDTYISTSSVSATQQELIRIRASQINGCAYCVHSHSQDAIKGGESFNKINLISVWREAKNVFTEDEQLIFRITEEITLISNHGLSDEVYEKAIATFGEQKTADIIMVILTINVWNRIGVGLHLQPEL